MKSFFKVKTVDQVLGKLALFEALDKENAALDNALWRVLAEAVTSPEDVPQFDRSTVDGYAVSAKDTFGATESLPALFELKGEVLMGQKPAMDLTGGTCLKIWTGGMLPAGSDAVVMLEYARDVDQNTVELARAVAPQENVIVAGEDVKAGQTLLEAGQRLRPQDLGLLAALGKRQVMVHRRPKVAVISTGDEIVPVDATPSMGQVRDINTYTLGAQVSSAHAIPIYLGLAKDNMEQIKNTVAKGLVQADVIILSGGSSVGVRDLTVEVFSSFPENELLVHGVSVSPGKPTILTKCGNQSLWGLPGHAVSAMVTFDIFLRPLLNRLSGLIINENSFGKSISAVLSRNLASVHGREDYVRVKLKTDERGKFSAVPVLGKSGLISTMVKADGLIKIGLNEEGLDKGSPVQVMLFEA